MPEFIIHVGPHKTGTTYLQLSLKASRATLRRRGIDYPDFWDHAPGNPSQLPLVQHLRENRMAALAPRFAAFNVDGVQKVLLSAEDLSNLPIDGLLRLKELIGANPVKIIFYLRRWSEMVGSSWQESVKQGHSHTLPEFLLQHLPKPEGSRLLNFDLKLAPLVEVFGMSSLCLISYSELRDRNRDMFQHFAANFLDWPGAAPYAELANANASRSPQEIELVRRLNSMARSGGEAPADRVRGAFDRARRTLEIEPLLEAMAPFMRKLRINDSWQVLQLLHQKLVAKYYDALLRPRQPDELFRAKAVDIPYVSSDYVLSPGVAAAMQDVMAAITETA